MTSVDSPTGKVLSALKIADPARWEATIIRAMKASQGRREAAAEMLGISSRHLARWLAELPDVERAPPGRPWPEGYVSEAEQRARRRRAKEAAANSMPIVKKRRKKRNLAKSA